jgi:hypothetical protein
VPSVSQPEVLTSSRSGDAYNAHSYHTKVPPAAIAQLIKRHLPHGGTVGDAFCGSGSTGIAAAIAEGPGRKYDVVLSDLSPYAAFIARNSNKAPDAAVFERGARETVERARLAIGSLWSTRHGDGRLATVIYVIWSEVLACPDCTRRLRFWDVGIDHRVGAVRRELTCGCGSVFRKAEAERVLQPERDPLLGRVREAPLREPVRLVYELDGKRFEKTPDQYDLARIEAARETAAPQACPNRRMLDVDGPWGDLYRAGYHAGITHVHHFYTWRSFVTVGHLWAAAAASEAPDSCQFLVSSYNLAHATLMSRVVFKRDSPKPVLTGYQTGTLYISSLPVEKNPLIGIERSKLPAVLRGLGVVRGRKGRVDVRTLAAGGWKDLDVKIDYAFLDPPFGANIPYAEANFIAESWLGATTDRSLEATISRSQDKSAEDYRTALAEGFLGVRGALSRSGRMTVMFHSAADATWRALTSALSDAGFETDSVLILDKRQGSFKQVRTDGAVSGDLLLETRPRRTAKSVPRRSGDGLAGATTWLEREMREPGRAIDKRRLYSRYIAHCVVGGVATEVPAADFYGEVERLTRPLTAVARPAA